jgi:hypothetical protein
LADVSTTSLPVASPLAALETTGTLNEVADKTSGAAYALVPREVETKQQQVQQQQQQQQGEEQQQQQQPEEQEQQQSKTSVLQHTSSAKDTSDTALAQLSAVASLHQRDDGEFDACKTCVYTLERIKKGTNLLLPAICSEIYMKFPDSYGLCHQVLNSLTSNGVNVRNWLLDGCYKYEVYNAKEWVSPCPTHVMCAVLKDLKGNEFCQALPQEDPFAA